MIKTMETGLVSLVMLGSMLFALLLATPVAAKPLSEAAINDRIVEFCEASSVDVVGKRMERQCRAELRAKLQQQAEREAAKAKLANR